MSTFKEIKEHSNDLFENLTQYIESRWNLAVLESAERASNVVSNVAMSFLFIAIWGIVSFFLSVALALWLGHWLGETAYGFLIMAGIYALLGLILYFMRHRAIRIPIINRVLKSFYYEHKN